MQRNRASRLPWSSHSQSLLVRAIQDPAFVTELRQRGYVDSHVKLWIAQAEVPVTYRGEMRAMVEDWAHAQAMGSRRTG
jgi:hypothetical protein